MKKVEIAKLVAVCKADGHDIGVFDGNRWIVNVLVWKTGKTAEEIADEIQAIADCHLVESLELRLMGNY